MQDKYQFDEQGKRNGYWERYWTHDKLWFKTNYINGKIYGFLEVYSTYNNLLRKEYYAR